MLAVIDQQMKDWLKVGVTLSYVRKNEGRVGDSNGSYNVIRNVVEMIPFIPYQYADGIMAMVVTMQVLKNWITPCMRFTKTIFFSILTPLMEAAMLILKFLKDLNLRLHSVQTFPMTLTRTPPGPNFKAEQEKIQHRFQVMNQYFSSHPTGLIIAENLIIIIQSVHY